MLFKASMTSAYGYHHYMCIFIHFHNEMKYVHKLIIKLNLSTSLLVEIQGLADIGNVIALWKLYSLKCNVVNKDFAT